MKNISYFNVCEKSLCFSSTSASLKYEFQSLYLHSILSIKLTELSSTHPHQLAL